MATIELYPDTEKGGVSILEPDPGRDYPRLCINTETPPDYSILALDAGGAQAAINLGDLGASPTGSQFRISAGGSDGWIGISEGFELSIFAGGGTTYGGGLLILGDADYRVSVEKYLEVTREIKVGVEDLFAGTLHVYGGSASLDGSEIRLHMDAVHDGEMGYWAVRTYQDRLQIYPEGLGDELLLGGTQMCQLRGEMALVQCGNEEGGLYLYQFSAVPMQESNLYFYKSASATAISDTCGTPGLQDTFGEIRWHGVVDGDWARGAFIGAWQCGAPEEDAWSVPGMLELATYKGVVAAEPNDHNPWQILLHPNGRVGFHTASPQSWLHVHRRGEACVVDLRFTNQTTDDESTDGLIIGIDGNSDGFMWNYEDKDLYFKTNSLTRLRIENDGKIGVGTDSPAGQLEVVQSNESGAIPVLVLDQDDTDESFIEFQGTVVKTSKTAETEYVQVTTPDGTRYLRLYS